ncbi:MAG TPA: signal peptidase II [Actinomycetes bacterium]|jgi:signal peptidase II|nr:signal peptidase II [Actinomycetes bacterium]
MRGTAGRLALVYGTAALIVAVDQLTKLVVVRTLAGRPPLRLVGSFVDLRYTTNSGGAFSLFTGAPYFFAVMAAVVTVAIMWSARRARGRPVLLALGLLLGGAIGNLLDRLFRGDVPLRGEVVDFVKVGPWPVFNVADSCIVIGGLLLAFLLGRAEPAGQEGGDRGPPASDASDVGTGTGPRSTPRA